MGLFGGLVNTWKNGYQFGDILKTLTYDVNPLAWAAHTLSEKIQGNDDFDMFNNNPNWEPSASDPIDQMIEYNVNKLTGHSYENPDVKHEEERQDTAIQRQAADAEAAGFTKYAYAGSPGAASSGADSGLSVLDAALQMQQLQQGMQNLKEQRYNLGVSEKLGIRTSDKNPMSMVSALFKAFTGKGIEDLPEDGLLGAFSDFLGGLFHTSSPDNPTYSGYDPSPVYEALSVGDGSVFDGYNLTGKYPSLFSTPEFLNAIFYDSDGKLNVPTYYWNQMKDDAEVAGMAFDDYKQMLLTFLSTPTGKKLYDEYRHVPNGGYAL